MSKSQINNLSKRQILESLMYEQNQSNATLSRLITAVARTAGVDPEKLAEMFIDDKANQEYVEKFNLGVKAKHKPNHPEEEHAHDKDGNAIAGAEVNDSISEDTKQNSQSNNA